MREYEPYARSSRRTSSARESGYARTEDRTLEEHHRRREERRRRERARLRRQRLAVTVTVATLLTVCACVGTARVLWPEPAAAREATSVIPEADSASAMLASATRLRKLAPAAMKPKPKPLTALKPAPGIRTLVLDKSAQTVTAYEEDGKPVGRWLCASGVYYPIVGEYEVTSKKPQSYYPADGSTFYHFTIFTKSEKGTNIGFHSVPTDKEGNVDTTLGKPISHGCVRLAADKAEFVYEWAPIGAKVIVEP